MQIGIELYALVISEALPIGLAFAIGDFMVVTFCNMMLSGKAKLGR